MISRFSIKQKMLTSFVALILVLVTVTTFITSRITNNALTENLSSSLAIIAQMAADGAKTGLAFDDVGAIETSMAPFEKQSLFSYLAVANANGELIVDFRREGFAKIKKPDQTRFDSLTDEMFLTVPVMDEENEIGQVSIGISLEGRNNTLEKAGFVTTSVAVVSLALFVLATIIIAQRIVGPIRSITNIARKLATGDLEQQVNVHRGDEIGELASSFRAMIDSQKEKAKIAHEIALGNLDVAIEPSSEADTLGAAMVTVKNSLKEMHAELHTTIESQKAGDLDARCDTSNLSGAYAELLCGVNDSLDAVIHPIFECITIMQNYAAGELTQQMRELPGKQIALTQSLEGIRSNLASLIEEGKKLATAAGDGQLDVRGNVDLFKGGYREIIFGFNTTIENIIKPLNEATESLSRIAGGDLTGTVAGEYKGDYAVIKKALNDTLDSLNGLLAQVSRTVVEVANGAQQVSTASESLSDRATKQASLLQEMSSSMAQIASQTKQNAESAKQANTISDTARSSAEDGNRHMKKMLSAMDDIKQSSGDISKIIKAIDEIAFQTNLLALNAAVEAARAGVHGKGFAVVAEEVRNLAQRSAKAAKETTQLIEDSVERVENGARIANLTAKSLKQIVSDVTEVSTLVEGIAQASREQAMGIEQVNTGLSEIDKVTQANTAGAEEGAAASQTLLSQANMVRSILSQFSLNDDGVVELSDPEDVAVADDLTVPPVGNEGGGWDDLQSSPDVIALDDDEFGDF